MLLILTFYSSKNQWEKNITGSKEILISTTVSTLIINQHIRIISERSLKTGVMADENSVLRHRNLASALVLAGHVSQACISWLSADHIYIGIRHLSRHPYISAIQYYSAACLLGSKLPSSIPNSSFRQSGLGFWHSCWMFLPNLE